MSRKSTNRPRSNGQRPLKVGEEMRHILAGIFLRADFQEPVLQRTPVTVAEVRVTPDLKNATAYVMPLNGQNREEVLEVLNRMAPMFRYQVTERMALRSSPRITFRIDDTYDEATRIDALLRNPKVVQDISRPDDED